MAVLHNLSVKVLYKIHCISEVLLLSTSKDTLLAIHCYCTSTGSNSRLILDHIRMASYYLVRCVMLLQLFYSDRPSVVCYTNSDVGSIMVLLVYFWNMKEESILTGMTYTDFCTSLCCQYLLMVIVNAFPCHAQVTWTWSQDHPIHYQLY